MNQKASMARAITKPKTRTAQRLAKPTLRRLRLRRPLPHYARAWVSLVSLSVLIACSHGLADSVPEGHELSGACEEYAKLIGECFGTPRLAETTRKSLSSAGRSPEQIEALEKQCQANLDNVRRSCK